MRKTLLRLRPRTSSAAILTPALLASAIAGAQPCHNPLLGPPPCLEERPGFEECCFFDTPPTGPFDLCPPLVGPFGCTGSVPVPCPPLFADCFGFEGPCFAAIGVWWPPPPEQEGLGAQSGVHLRWALNLVPHEEGVGGWPYDENGLVFPRGGFEVQRREQAGPTGGGPWETVCPRLYPATDVATALSRIPPTLPPEEAAEYTVDRTCNGVSDLEDLIGLVRRAVCVEEAYKTLVWIEGTDRVYGDGPSPESVARGAPDEEEGCPFPPDGNDPDCEFNWYIDHADDFEQLHRRPPVTFEFKPAEFLALAALDPVLARVLGLYFVDTTAAPDHRYEYRVIAHYDWDYGFRMCALVPVSTFLAEVPPVEPPAGFSATEPAESERPMVELEWENQIETAVGLPENRLELEDGFVPLRYILWREDLGEDFGFRRLTTTSRICGIDRELLVPPLMIGGEPHPLAELVRVLNAILLLLGREPLPLPPDVWKSPPYTRDLDVQPGRRYRYRLRGMDIFGRYSPPVDSLAVDVSPRSVVPAPILAEARIYQRDEVELVGGKGTIVLRARWLWPLSFRETYPGEPEAFRVFMGEPGVDPEAMVELARVDASKPADLWEFPRFARPCDDGLDNDLDELVDLDDPDCEGEEDPAEGVVACNDGRDNDLDGLVDFPADPGCANLADTTEEPDTAELFEAVVSIDPKRFPEPVSEVHPAEKISTFEVGVRAYDSNGAASALVRRARVAIRDFTFRPESVPVAPARPLEPGLDAPRPPSPPDAEGRSAIALEWPARANLTYLLYRTDDRAICRAKRAAGEVVTCSDLEDGELQDYASGHLAERDLFTHVTPGAMGPLGGEVDGADPDAVIGPFQFTDRVPGLASGRYLYTLQAADPAGNVSDPSPVSEVVHVEDGLAPSKPIIARALAIDPRKDARRNAALVEWLPSPEDPSACDPPAGPCEADLESPCGLADLAFYRLYRTDVEAWARSRRKMTLVATRAAGERDGAYYQVVDVVPRPERTQHYRLEAVDCSGNVSALSEVGAVDVIDREPPAVPVWLDRPPFWACEGEDPVVVAGWRASGEGVETRLERRRPGGAWIALTEWLPSERNHWHEDCAAGEGCTADPALAYDYRAVARDLSGNKSATSAWRLGAAPDCEPPTAFIRGDANVDDDIDLGDAFFLICVLFGRFCPEDGGGGGLLPPFPCEAGADVNGSGAVDLSDVIYLLRFLFVGGRAPPEPYPDCGAREREPLPCEVSGCDRRRVR